ncbi:MAG: spermidine synthase [Gemmatimonadetes bacterium]|nr:spermidine synthase [Gemmatimonadota bacterium]
MKPLERLAAARTPTGSVLELFRHDGAYLIRADGVELMSTRRHHSEDALAELACAPHAGTEGVRVLIGGLGLGFTLRAALRVLPQDAQVWVAELLPEVIAWNADPAYGISVEALQDPRVRVVEGDVTALLRTHPGHFHAIMLDTDNGPDGMLLRDNAPLYAARGIQATKAALCDGGTIAYWSVADDPRFAGAVEGAGMRVATHRVRAHATSGPWHTIYVATPRLKRSRWHEATGDETAWEPGIGSDSE